MLGKLMKYEVMATSRIFLPLYGLILLLAGFNRVFLPLNSSAFDIPRMITMTVYVSLIVALFVMTLVMTIQRFNKNLLGDEGYLSFTLPVRTWCHIVSKATVTLMWTTLSLIVSFFSIFLLAVGNAESMREFSRSCMQLGNAFHYYGGWAWLILAECLVLYIAMTFGGVIEIYAAVSVGHLAPRHKLLSGFGAFIGFGVAEQLIIALARSFINTNSWFGFYNDAVTVRTVSMVLLCFILYCVVSSVVFFFLTNWILKRKLNLE